jgi:hypothetical protein
MNNFDKVTIEKPQKLLQSTRARMANTMNCKIGKQEQGTESTAVLSVVLNKINYALARA